MLLALQFPLADSRPFVKDSGLRRVPGWLEPRPDEEFLRYFGMIRLRKSGGLPGWVGENEICEANQALRFPRGLGSVPADPDRLIRLQCLYRRFYSDGYAVGKYEVGVGPQILARNRSAGAAGRDRAAQFTGEQISALINLLLHTPVTIRNLQTGQPVEVEMGRAGKALAALYLAASGDHPTAGAADWWVVNGAPLLFLEQRGRQPIKLAQPRRTIELDKRYRLDLSYCLWPYAGGRIRMWVLQRQNRTPYSDEYRVARTLRVYLMRLHAEHECLQALLRNIRDGHLTVARGDPESEALQAQLRRSMERIGSYETRAAREFSPEIAAIARQSVDAMSPGQRDRLVQRLQELDLRGNLVRGVRQYADGVLAGAEGQGAAQMQAETKLDLAKALLACPSIEDAGARAAIIQALPQEIKNTAPRSNIPIVDVMNLIGAALNYPDGLTALIDLVRSLEGDSLPLREVDRVMAEWHNQQALHAAGPSV
ncbi:MAG: hypothetical protein BWY52_01946 [Chloroflexi bacterium ADurb.Bin325]|nr:MAG: hypothetical protein BWY52_01946 [Chloroflexi bacterium ADurb.Bin325]